MNYGQERSIITIRCCDRISVCNVITDRPHGRDLSGCWTLRRIPGAADVGPRRMCRRANHRLFNVAEGIEGMKSARSKATDIPMKVKKAVHERDTACIFCGKPGMPNCHIVSRAHGGLGVEENIVEACMQCHHMMDNSDQRPNYVERAIRHIRKYYPDWSKEAVTYDKWACLKGA